MAKTASTAPVIALTEQQAAEALGFTIHWLRKDRAGPRKIPFFRIGRAVRYSPERIRQALERFEEGGAH